MSAGDDLGSEDSLNLILTSLQFLPGLITSGDYRAESYDSAADGAGLADQIALTPSGAAVLARVPYLVWRYCSASSLPAGPEAQYAATEFLPLARAYAADPTLSDIAEAKIRTPLDTAFQKMLEEYPEDEASEARRGQVEAGVTWSVAVNLWAAILRFSLPTQKGKIKISGGAMISAADVAEAAGRAEAAGQKPLAAFIRKLVSFPSLYGLAPDRVVGDAWSDNPAFGANASPELDKTKPLDKVVILQATLEDAAVNRDFGIDSITFYAKTAEAILKGVPEK